MDSILKTLVITTCLTFLVGIVWHFLTIKLSLKYGYVDRPSFRKRHRKPTAILGGAGIVGTFVFGLIFLAAIRPTIYQGNIHSLLSIGIPFFLLFGLGLYDDKKGLAAWKRIAIEALAACIALTEPNIYAYLFEWQIIFGYLIWPLAVLGFVTIINAINIIDGVDGLSSGVSFIIGLTILITATRSPTIFVFQETLFLTALLVFIFFNTVKKSIFLGDNGTLPVGFLLACLALMSRPVNTKWQEAVSLLFIFAFPLLDMGTTTFKRLKGRSSPLRADRNHIHFRLMRLGLTPLETTLIIWAIAIQFSLISYLVANLDKIDTAVVLTLTGFFLAVFTITLSLIERWKAHQRLKQIGPLFQLKVSGQNDNDSIEIDLRPFLESGTLREKQRVSDLAISLTKLISLSVHEKDRVYFTDNGFAKVDLHTNDLTHLQLRTIVGRLTERISNYFKLMNIELTCDKLPVRVITVSARKKRNGQKQLPVN